MKIVKSVLIALSFAVLVSGSASAVRAQNSPPSEQHKKLDALAGNWDVVVTFTLGGQENKGTATCESKWILSGKFLQQEYHSKFGDQPFIVMQWLGYDVAKKKFVELKMDNMDTAVMHNEGSISEDGKSLSANGETIDPMSGKPAKLRTAYTLADKDHFTLEWYMTGPDGKEARVVVLSHTRKKA